ncbi:hypothetical protein FM038_25545 [Shewanella eurypsychrophilus]|uniref:Uncharacterized protein n=1 Tax=Shewanella eurypsychrophilus TaxID=2593656 RepID=A0ABX8S6G6_9GAMM|nr:MULTISPECIES: hypothetical protein [Shewanella]QFU23227.1 hypothetical protein FS418_16045 [Shewanella sp. YLB-09]QXP44819.1 hypothetical protein FM038_25545 [Shewanella eurypsychrophilus]
MPLVSVIYYNSTITFERLVSEREFVGLLENNIHEAYQAYCEYQIELFEAVKGAAIDQVKCCSFEDYQNMLIHISDKQVLLLD